MQSIEVRQEASMPVQSRVSVIDLAELDEYWDSGGYRIKTISQLISWSLELLCNILRANGKLPREINTVVEANKVLEARMLRQAGMRHKAFMKNAAAVRFESMREEGNDPRREIADQYKVLHNAGSVQGMPEEMKAGYVSPYEADWMKAKQAKQMEEYERRKKEREEAISNTNIVHLKEGMSSTELDMRNEERDREIIKKENAPLDMEFLKSQAVKE